jgi:hypothetical protein
MARQPQTKNWQNKANPNLGTGEKKGFFTTTKNMTAAKGAVAVTVDGLE